jgi:hypothetical protein
MERRKFSLLDDDRADLFVQSLFETFQVQDSFPGKRNGNQFQAQGMGVGPGDDPVFGVKRASEEAFSPALDSLGHQDALGHRRSAVIHRSVGDIHSGELTNEGLELEYGLERTLTDLRLVRGVGRVKLRAPQHVVHDGGSKMVVGPGPQERDQRFPRFSFLAEGAELLDKLHLR